MDEKEYIVKYWEDEECREVGLSEIDDFFDDKDEAIKHAKQLFYKQDFACVEVLLGDECGDVVYGIDANGEWDS